MAALATQTIKRSGLNPAFTAAAGGGDTMLPGARTFLVVKNGGGAPIDVTIDATKIPEADMLTADLKVTVTNAQERWIGPIDATTFADPTTGRAGIAYSGVGTVTVGVFDLSS